jgi:hypothetical protein
MKIIQVISEHKKNKANQQKPGRFHTKRGWGEVTVEENGQIVTRHRPLEQT